MNTHKLYIYFYVLMNRTPSLCHFSCYPFEICSNHKASNHFSPSTWNIWTSECSDCFSLHLRDPIGAGVGGLAEYEVL